MDSLYIDVDVTSINETQKSIKNYLKEIKKFSLFEFQAKL